MRVGIILLNKDLKEGGQVEGIPDFLCERLESFHCFTQVLKGWQLQLGFRN